MIAAIMLNPESLDEIADIVGAADFLLPECRIVFEAVGEMRAQHKPVDPLTVSEHLKNRNLLEEIGGEEFLAEATERLPHAAHVKHYAEMVREASMRRATVLACTDAIHESSGAAPIDDVISAVEGRLHAILERQAGRVEVTLTTLLLDAVNRVGAGKSFGLATGFCELDKLINGFQRKNLTVLAARPSVGKTALAVKFLMQATRNGVPATFFSLEQSDEEISERILSMESHVAVTAMRAASVSEDLKDRLMMNASAIADWPLRIDATPGRTLATLAAMARLHKRRHGTQMIVVDYLQLIEPADRRTPREQQVSEISRGLKRIAKELDVAVICLAQLNRQIEMRSDKVPQLSDLRESGAIEQDADVVMMIDRPWLYDTQQDETEAWLYVRKNRNGMTGRTKLYWDGPTMEYRQGTVTDYGPEPDLN